jgi:hypothetical protein
MPEDHGLLAGAIPMHRTLFLSGAGKLARPGSLAIPTARTIAARISEA